MEVPERRSSRSRSRCWRRRCATRTSTRARRSVEVHVGAPTARSCSRSATTARAPATRAGSRDGAAAGRGRGAPARRRRRVRPGAAGRWRVRLVVPLEDESTSEPGRGLRVLVVDDHDVVHWGFRLLLTEQPWVERCLTARDARGGAGRWRAATSRTSRSSTCSSARSRAPSCASDPARASPAHARAADLRRRPDLAAGGQGRGRVGLRLEGLGRGTTSRWPCGWSGKGMTVFAPRAEQPSTPLSEREREVLDLMASGATNREIAERLFLSPHTVKEHTSALYRKLGCATAPRPCSAPSAWASPPSRPARSSVTLSGSARGRCLSGATSSGRT